MKYPAGILITSRALVFALLNLPILPVPASAPVAEPQSGVLTTGWRALRSTSLDAGLRLDATYEDPEGFFALDYPKSWRAKRSGSEMQFWADTKGSAAIAISLHIKAISAEGLADEITQLLSDRRDGYREGARHEAEVDGYDAVWVNHVYEEKGIAYQGVFVALVRNRIGFLLIGWAPKKDYAKYDATLKAIVNSLRITSFAASPAYERWRTTQSEHFVFRYLPSTYVARNIKRIAQDHEQVYEDILQTLGLEYSQSIAFYLYPSEESLYRATARRSGHAINAAGEVHALWVSANDHQSLGHEMTHVITAQAIGEPNEALLGEGIAVCLDHSGKDYHAIAADLLASGDLIELSDILGDAWFEHDAEIVYPESGSFACFLLQKYGADAFMRVYTAADFSAETRSVYKASLATLEKRWLATLR